MIKSDRWRPADGLRLEPNALVAVCEPRRSLALTAGPGAGKTEMLAQRADFLLRTGACRYPQRILAIAFKVDAARNLKERVRRRCGPELSARLDSHTFHAFSKRLIDRFRPILVGLDALDHNYTVGQIRIDRQQVTYEDLVPLAVRILQNCTVARNAIRQTYSHVFLDEFQDCTTPQYQLIREAFFTTSIPLTAVGDTKQLIMGWAGALKGVFQKFALDFEATSLNLYQNFRAQPLLRRMQNAMVKVMDPAAAVLDSELTGSGGSVEIIESEGAYDEAVTVADRIEEWIAEGLPASEIAVLVSRQPELYTRHLATELERRGVPFRNEQILQDIATQPIAQLIVNFLRVAVGERQADAYEQLMDILLATGVDEDDAYSRRARWHRFIEEAREQAGDLNANPPRIDHYLRELSARFVETVGKETLAGLSADYERGDRLTELITETHDRISELITQDSNVVRALSRFSEGSAIRIMTIHKSKGLEFDSVVMLGIEEETFWGNIAEERSAFFVGISRAKKRLVLSTSKKRERPAGFRGRWVALRTQHREFLEYARSVL